MPDLNEVVGVDKLNKEIFDNLVYQGDSYVNGKTNVKDFDSKQLRNAINNLKETHKDIGIVTEKNNSIKHFDPNRKEVIKFLSLSGSTDAVENITPKNFKFLIANNRVEIKKISNQEKMKIFNDFSEWLNASYYLNQINDTQREENEAYFLKLLNTNKAILNPITMDDNISGYPSIFYDSDEYQNELITAIFKYIEGEDFDYLLETYHDVNLIVLATTSMFISKKFSSFNFDYAKFQEDISHNDTYMYSQICRELLDEIIDNLSNIFKN